MTQQNYDYTKYSYDELVDYITNEVSGKEAWKDAYQSSTGQILIQLLAGMTDQLHYLLERRTHESFLPTSKLKTSVGALSNLLGYRPKRSVSPRGTVSIDIFNAIGDNVNPLGDISIPKYTKMTMDGVDYITLDDILITPSTPLPIEARVSQGTMIVDKFNTAKTQSFIDGNFVILKDYDSVDESDFFILVGTEEYTDIRNEYNGDAPLGSLSFATAIDPMYDVRMSHDGIRILFGDGRFGKKPVGDIEITYVKTKGSEIEVITLGNNFKLKGRFINDTLGVKYNYSIKNTTQINGGRSAETIEETKRNAPEYIRTAERAVTKRDWEYWMTRTPVQNIVDTRTYGESELGVVNEYINNVFAVCLKPDASELTFPEKVSIDKFMSNYKPLTTHLVMVKPEEVLTQLDLRISENPLLEIPRSAIYSEVRSHISEFFKYTTGSLGRGVHHSDIITHMKKLVLTVNGAEHKALDYLTLDVKCLHKFDTIFDTSEGSIIIDEAVDGETYRIIVDNDTYIYIATGSDTKSTIVSQFVTQILSASNVNYYAAIGDVPEEIKITSIGADELIVLNASSDTDKIHIDFTVYLPTPKLKNDANEDFFVPSTIEILDSDGNVLQVDDGVGGLGAYGTVDYKTGYIHTIVLPVGNYYVRYLQNEDQSIFCLI